MSAIRIVDVVDAAVFGLVPPCADERFDHRTCDYWEDADRGSRVRRESWLRPQGQPPAGSGPRPRRDPFGIDPDQAAADIAVAPANPFLPTAPPARVANPFAFGRDADGFGDSPFAAPPRADNPFAPTPTVAALPSSADLPRKLALLSRGLRVFGTYARVLLVDDVAVAYALPAAPRRAAAGGDHLRRHHARSARRRACTPTRRRRLRRARSAGVRGGRGVPRDGALAGCDERGHSGVLGARGVRRRRGR